MNETYTGQELVSWNSGALSAGNTSITSYGDYWDYWHYHYYPIYYPTYHICEKSKVEQAFKIVGKLLEMKLIKKDLTLKEFIKLVNDVAELI